MGINERLRDLEAARESSAEAQRLESNRNANRALLANELLRALSTETLGVLRERGHPTAVEMLSVHWTPGGLIRSGKVRYTAGRTLTLMQKTTQFGWGIGTSNLGITDAGVLVRFTAPAFDERRHGPGVTSRMHAELRAEAQRSGHMAAVGNAVPVPAWDKQRYERDAEAAFGFHLSEADELMMMSEPADVWMAKQIAR